MTEGKRCLTDGSPVTPGFDEIDEATHQQLDHVVLCPGARAAATNRLRPFRDTYIHDKCGSITRMGYAIADTYAVDPKFYTSTFCCTCRGYYPVGEFKWEDGTVVGS